MPKPSLQTGVAAERREELASGRDSSCQESEFGDQPITSGGIRTDLQSALENLGYKPAQIAPVLDEILAEDDSAPVESLLREALRSLAAPLQAKIRAKVEAATASSAMGKVNPRPRRSS